LIKIGILQARGSVAPSARVQLCQREFAEEGGAYPNFPISTSLTVLASALPFVFFITAPTSELSAFSLPARDQQE
jgi:hypothetical protein